MRRGRPPYPDVLTPREQEVLALIRDGLTNDQIAARLGISESGARYHVSEILSKLGVSSRYEAAQWAGEVAAPRRFRLSLPHLSPTLLAGGAVATAAVALVGLAVGVLIMDAREQDVEPTPGAGAAVTNSPDEQRELLWQRLSGTARELYITSRALTADPRFCEGCPITDPAGLRSLTESPCGDVGPTFTNDPAFDPTIHEPLHSIILDSCGRLSTYVDEANLVPNARSVVAILEPIVLADRAKLQATVPRPVVAPGNPPQAPNAYPIGTMTGVVTIDATLTKVYSGEWRTMALEAAYRELPCTYIPFLFAAPLCEVGETEGAVQSAIPVGGCEASMSGPNLVESSLPVLAGMQLRAVFEVDSTWARNGRFVLLFAAGNSRDWQLILDNDGRVAGFGGCGPADWLPGPNDRTILPRPS
jgi:DNA-binding CsgD family transcriptional regulator